jgi:hypothetical protein
MPTPVSRLPFGATGRLDDIVTTFLLTQNIIFNVD